MQLRRNARNLIVGVQLPIRDCSSFRLSVYRALEICKRVGDDTDASMSFDMVEEDYRALLDAIDEAKGFHIIRQFVETKASRPQI